MKIFFICGIDTDVGKTYVTSQLIYQALTYGKTVASYKPIQTGSNLAFQSEDLIAHKNQVTQLLEQTDQLDKLANYLWQDNLCSVSFKAPTSPHLAANLEKANYVNIEFLTNELENIIKQKHQRIKFANSPNYLFIETAGGLLSAISPMANNLDLLHSYKDVINKLKHQGYDLDLQVVLVTIGRLGAISSTLACVSLLPQLDYLVFNNMSHVYLDHSNLTYQINQDSQYFYQQLIALANNPQLNASDNLHDMYLDVLGLFDKESKEIKKGEEFLVNSSIYQDCSSIDENYLADYKTQVNYLISFKNYQKQLRKVSYLVIK